MVKKKKPQMTKRQEEADLMRNRIRQRLRSPAMRMSSVVADQIFRETESRIDKQEDDVDKACREAEEHFDHLFGKRQVL